MKVLFVQEIGDERREFAFEAERTSIGRASDADIQIGDEGLSRLNSNVFIDEDRAWIADNGSTNGTFVNDAPAGADGIVL